MAGEWLKFDKATPEKPEVFAMATELGIDPDAVVGKLMRVWSWFDTHTTDGNAASVTPALLDRIAGVTGFVVSMSNCGWISIEKHGCVLPNFSRHCGETAKGRALGAKRSAGFRSRNGASVTSALPREEKRREEKKEQEQEAPPSAKAPQAIGSRLPADWQPSPDELRWARDARPDLAVTAEVESFRDYWIAKPGKDGRKTDWTATWRNWIRRANAPRGHAVAEITTGASVAASRAL